MFIGAYIYICMNITVSILIKRRFWTELRGKGRLQRIFGHRIGGTLRRNGRRPPPISHKSPVPSLPFADANAGRTSRARSAVGRLVLFANFPAPRPGHVNNVCARSSYVHDKHKFFVFPFTVLFFIIITVMRKRKSHLPVYIHSVCGVFSIGFYMRVCGARKKTKQNGFSKSNRKLRNNKNYKQT